MPTGKTLGDIVQRLKSSLNNMEGDSMGGAFGGFIATVGSNGPLDFKNNFRGFEPASSLGDQGNFAYGALASGIGLPQWVAEAGAGAYALKNGKVDLRNPFREVRERGTLVIERI